MNPTGAMILLCILAVLPYLPALRGEFLFDDPYLFKPGYLQTVYRHVWQFRGSHRSLTHLLDCLLFRRFQVNPTGMDETGTVIVQSAVPWHVLSLAFHLGTTWAVWGLLGLFLEPWRAFAGAAIFAVHPLQVGAVAYISARAGVQAAFFSALGLLHAAAGGWHWAAVPVCVYFSYKSKQDGLLYLSLYPLILWKTF